MHIVIVGGGSVGSSTAYHLASRPDFKGTITVIERDPTYRIASSSLSASSIRMQFSTPVCIAMSQYGWDFLAAMPQAGLKERAYLVLATAAACGEATSAAKTAPCGGLALASGGSDCTLAMHTAESTESWSRPSSPLPRRYSPDSAAAKMSVDGTPSTCVGAVPA